MHRTARLTLDHLMVECTDPSASAHTFAALTGLPYAWPLVETEAYDSIGVNLGAANIEFIRFRTRFGRPARPHEGLSGAAFAVQGDLDGVLAGLDTPHRLGETTQAHTTITLAEELVYPTVFLVKYHFDTAGWRERLRREHAACAGGRFGIDGIAGIGLAGVPGELALLCDGLHALAPDCLPAVDLSCRVSPDAQTWKALQVLLGSAELRFRSH